ncbi:MAG: sulfotransferase family protein [Flavobacteriales bacterium]
MLPQPQNRIIAVGFQKTGTSSLREALKALGYKVRDGGFELFPAAVRRDRKRILRALEPYDAVEDNPWPLLYRELDEWVPGGSFILTVRDEDEWIRSVSRHIGKLRSPMHEWIYGVGKGLPQEDPENALQVYRAHNEAVRAHFKDRPTKFLELDFSKGDGWERLCAFLDREVPDIPFPHSNDSRSSKRRRPPLLRAIKRGKKRSKYFFVRKYYEWRGYGK